MSFNTRLFIFMALVVLGIGLFVMRDNEERTQTQVDQMRPAIEAGEANAASPDSNIDTPPTLTATPSPSATPTLSPSPRVSPPPASADGTQPETQSRRPLRDQIPSLKAVRKEVAADPHRTPLSLIEFSVNLGRKMQAVQNDSQAAELFRELEDCTLNQPESKTLSTRALCLSRARRLSKKYESLQSSYATLESRTDKEVVRLSKEIN